MPYYYYYYYYYCYYYYYYPAGSMMVTRGPALHAVATTLRLILFPLNSKMEVSLNKPNWST